MTSPWHRPGRIVLVEDITGGTRRRLPDPPDGGMVVAAMIVVGLLGFVLGIFVGLVVS